MRIGVICEGPTDFHAIEHFLKAALSAENIPSEFVPIQPEMDNSQPAAGWGNVFTWLERFDHQYRIQNFFGGGLFGGGLQRQPLDCILIQIDTDILEESSFIIFSQRKFGIQISDCISPDERAKKIRIILGTASHFDKMTNTDIRRHILAPAVESTESWCVAAFNAQQKNYEHLRGQDLTDAFMSALEASEGRPIRAPYTSIDKSPDRRKRFCATHSVGWKRISLGCESFERIYNEIKSIP